MHKILDRSLGRKCDIMKNVTLIVDAKNWFQEEIDSNGADITRIWRKILQIRKTDVRFADALATVFYCGCWNFNTMWAEFNMPSTSNCVSAHPFVRRYMRGHAKRLLQGK